MKKILCAICLVGLLVSGAAADVLWDQSNLEALGDGFLNISSSSCNFINGNTKLHTANDVTFNSDVTVNSVTIWETEGNGNAAAATMAYLWIAPKTGTIPTASSDMVNTAGNLVSISTAYVVQGGVPALEITASGLDINLMAGDYWVSLTPVCQLGFWPYSVHTFSADGIVGDPTAAISACSVNSDWLYPFDPDMKDTTLRVEGTVPVVATEETAWGGIKALYR